MKPRHTVSIDDETSAELNALAAKPGVSKTAIMRDAIRHYIRYRGAHALDESLRIRLDRLSDGNNLIRRDVDILIESLASFVRLYLTFNAHTPIPDKATQAVAHARYEKFVEQVGRQVAGRKRSLGTKGEGETDEQRI
ncbi:ribbon-helix-helix protein, CopG family [Chelativorans alearense]|uniref:ribbon-helix-helix protein, CopG family n=1 Tax=Chelativorans alearense TaxID=2681495 RepID=UPI0013D08718|nr:ribbon-helix-helix protein, CopG family [Chelativorans alearense]